MCCATLLLQSYDEYLFVLSKKPSVVLIRYIHVYFILVKSTGEEGQKYQAVLSEFIHLAYS